MSRLMLGLSPFPLVVKFQYTRMVDINNYLDHGITLYYNRLIPSVSF